MKSSKVVAVPGKCKAGRPRLSDEERTAREAEAAAAKAAAKAQSNSQTHQQPTNNVAMSTFSVISSI